MPRERTQHKGFGGNFDSADYNSSKSPSKGASGASGRRTEAPDQGKGTRWADAPVQKVSPKK